jgi:hypothetical protein
MTTSVARATPWFKAASKAASTNLS